MINNRVAVIVDGESFLSAKSHVLPLVCGLLYIFGVDVLDLATIENVVEVMNFK